MNSQQFNTNYNIGRGTSSTFNGGKTGNRGGSIEYSGGKGGSGRGRIGDGGSFNSAIQNKSFSQRIVTNNYISSENLADLFIACNTHRDLRELYEEHKNKSYFNYIPAKACFSQVLKLYRNCTGQTSDKKQLKCFLSGILTNLIKQSKTFEELKTLYNEQKDKEYFSYITLLFVFHKL